MKKPSKDQLLEDVLSNLTWNQIADKYGYTDSRYLRKLSITYGLPKRRTYLKPSKEELEHLILVKKLSPYEIADKLGYSEGGWSNIYAYCREYGIPVDFKPNSSIHKQPFSNEQISFIYGTLLGDGYLRPSGNGFALSQHHSTKQYRYLLWKYDILKNFVVSEPVIDGLSCRFNTINHSFLTDVHNICYPDGAKHISDNWLSKINELALAVWYMDDGSINKRYKTITLCTNCFNYEEHLILQSWFSNRFNIPSVIEPRRNNQYSLRINARHSKAFLNLVKPYIPDCMNYKLGE